MDNLEKDAQGRIARRTLLKGIASLMATHSMPASKLLPILDKALAGGPADLAKVLPIVDMLISPGAFGRFSTAKNVEDGRLNTALDVDLSHLDFSRRLGIAWGINLTDAAQGLQKCEQLEQAIKLGHAPSADRLFSLMEVPENREKVAQALFEREARSIAAKTKTYPVAIAKHTFEMYQRHCNNVVDTISELAIRYPLRENNSLEVLAIEIRRNISGALDLTLENGCMDVASVPKNLKNLQYLLNAAPELFPAKKLSVFRLLADDLALHDRQTIRLEDVMNPKEDWHLHAEKLLYRFGLTLLQNTWSKGQIEYQPSLAKIRFLQSVVP